MKNVVLTGIGGQGTVLAAKILAQAAQARGWHVRTAETIGMAQRGGSVTSHVRMGNEGEHVASPLVGAGAADMLIAFEPGEAARMLGLLDAQGVLVTASNVKQPVTASLLADLHSQGVAENVLAPYIQQLMTAAQTTFSPEMVEQAIAAVTEEAGAAITALEAQLQALVQAEQTAPQPFSSPFCWHRPS